MTSVINQLLAEEAFVDVTLACDGARIKAHRVYCPHTFPIYHSRFLLIRWLVAQVVLSACSPYFQRVLLDNPCKHPVLILPVGVGHADLRAIVEFIYRGETYVTRDQLSSIVRVAELLKIKGMQCEIISWLFFN
jgi:broad-like protein